MAMEALEADGNSTGWVCKQHILYMFKQSGSGGVEPSVATSCGTRVFARWTQLKLSGAFSKKIWTM